MNQTLPQWWENGKFGLFIHFGLYSVLGGAYKGKRTDNIAEWIMHDLDIPREEYRKLAVEFNPVHFDADSIVRSARDTGMSYVVFTSKHHDGFAMYDSKVSTYSCTKGAPFARDPLAELRTACDKYGLKLCIYYSQAQDWDHPDACRDGVSGEGKNFDEYFYKKCIPQVKELLINYGEIGLIWFDTPMYMSRAHSIELKKLVKSLQPDCLVSGRIGSGIGDYMTTGDNFIPLLPFNGPFEVPATMNATWGYNQYDQNWKSAGDIIRSLAKIVSRGGHYLLNIGPDGTGHVPEASVKILDAVGSFMKQNGDSIRGASSVPVYPYDIEGIFYTTSPHRLFIHNFKDQESLYLLNISSKPLSCYRLSDGKPLDLKERTTCEGDSSWLISLPARAEDEIDQVICVDIEEEQVSFEPIHW